MWVSTVFGLRKSYSAIWRLVWRATIRCAISSSRLVSAATPAASALDGAGLAVDAPAEPAQFAFGGVAVAQRTDRLQLGGGPGELLHGAVAVAGGGQRSAGERAADLRLHDRPDARGELDRAARELGGLDRIAGVERDGGRGTTARVGGNLGYDVRFVLDATHTFNRRTPTAASSAPTNSRASPPPTCTASSQP